MLALNNTTYVALFKCYHPTTTTTTTDLFVPCMKGKKLSNSIVLFTSLISGTGPNK